MSRANGTTWCGIGFVVLAAITAAATIASMGVNAGAYESWINADPQGNDQAWDALRTSAALMYTSGHSVGHLCAALFGVAVGTATAGRRRRSSLAVAVAGGVGLAAVSVALALPRAATEVGKLWMTDELTRHGFSFDPDLLHDRGVLAFLAVGLVAFPLWAALGLGGSLARRPRTAVALALAWYPASLIGGFLTAGIPGLMFPLYSNIGTALLVLKWPAAALVVGLVLALWAAGMCLTGFATKVVAARPTADRPQSEPPAR